jgi:signal peptidase I
MRTTTRTVAGLMVAALLGGAAVWARQRLVTVAITGSSMAPTYAPGDRVLVRRRGHERLRRGDVVVVERPDPLTGWSELPPFDGRLPGREWVIKRAVALPGDEVPEPVRRTLALAARDVPPRSLVLLGDNPESADSRHWGFCPADRLLGVAVLRLAGRTRG